LSLRNYPYGIIPTELSLQNYPYGIIPTELSLRNYPYDLNCCYGDYKIGSIFFSKPLTNGETCFRLFI
ncbi:hypothetical protein, partial [Microcystis sp. M63BS1]|uniref:hypothetical protein n=1 Tax=Microcystis sp. M63BS1 TaxID=2771205 RepID=UPI00258110EC